MVVIPSPPAQSDSSLSQKKYQSQFAHFGEGEGKGQNKIRDLNIQFYDEGLNLGVDTTLPPLLPWLPAYLTFRDPVFYVGSDTENQMVGIKTSTLRFKLNDDYILKDNIGIKFVNSEALNAYLRTVMERKPDDPPLPDLLVSANVDTEILGTVCMNFF